MQGLLISSSTPVPLNFSTNPLIIAFPYSLLPELLCDYGKLPQRYLESVRYPFIFAISPA